MTLRPSAWLAALPLLVACGGVVAEPNEIQTPATIEPAPRGNGTPDATKGSGAAAEPGQDHARPATGETLPSRGGAAPACAIDVLPPGSPSADASPCSLLGTWDVTPSAFYNPATPYVIAFDGQSRFTSSLTPKADLCVVPPGESGTWSASGAHLSLTSLVNVGGPCAKGGWDPEQTFDLVVDESCNTITLFTATDSCTGAGILYDRSVLRRRP